MSLRVTDRFSCLASSFQPVVNRQIFAGNLVNAQTLRKEKYPREFFPEVRHEHFGDRFFNSRSLQTKWSRKGFTQTRWSINSL